MQKNSHLSSIQLLFDVQSVMTSPNSLKSHENQISFENATTNPKQINFAFHKYEI